MEAEGVTNYETYKNAIDTVLSKPEGDGTLLDDINTETKIDDEEDDYDIDDDVKLRMSDPDSADIDDLDHEDEEYIPRRIMR